MKTRDFKHRIEFSNNGGLSFFFLGTGSAFSKKYMQNNFLIIKGNDHILVDCGTLCPFSLSQFDSSITEIKNFVITHAHADHAGGLEEAALQNMYITKKKPNILIEDSFKKQLWNFTLSGGLGKKGEEDCKSKMSFDDYFEQIKPVAIKKAPRPFFEANIGSINLKLFRTKHVYNKKDNWKNAFYSVGLLIDNKVIFTGDSQADKELIEWLNGEYDIEIIFHDCQFVQNAVHCSYDELCNIMTPDVRAKTLLCHYNDNIENHLERIKADGFAGCVQRGIYYDL